MIIGIMTVNGFDFHPNARFREEARRRGHKVILIDPYGVGCRLDASGAGMVRAGAGEPPDATVPDLVMPRQGSPMGEYGFVLLRQFQRMGIPVINSLEGVTIARNQFISLQQLNNAGLPVPPSFFVTREDMFFEAVSRLGGYPVVAKQVSGMGGDGVAKLTGRGAAESFLSRELVPEKGLVVEPYLDRRHDLRLMVVGDRVAGAMALTPAPGQFRANVHQQAKAEALDPPDEVCRTAVAAARACRLDIAGVDMMVTRDRGTLVLEVNYSPGFRGIEQATGMNMAGMILDHVLALYKKRRTPAKG